MSTNPHQAARPRCRRCGAEIIFIRSAGSGKHIPCDPAPVESNGSQTLVVRDEAGFGVVTARVPRGKIGYTSHFASCPYADEFRKRSKPLPASPAAPVPPPDAQLCLPL